MDFGVGRALESTASTLGSSLTGTPLYMAPEMLRHAESTVRSDLYSLGVLLYRLVTRGYPVRGRSLDELRAAHAKGEVRRLRDERPDLPTLFVQAVEKALAPEPSRRHASAGEMELALAESLGSERTNALSPADAARVGAARGVDPRDASGPPAAAAPPPVARRQVSVAVAVVASVAIVAVGGAALYLRDRDAVESGAGGSLLEGTSARDRALAPSGTSAPAPAPLQVESAIFRVVRGTGTETPREERLETGDRIRVGEDLYATIEASDPVYAYLLTEDEKGALFLHYPPVVPYRPLAANREWRLPLTVEGEPQYMRVTTAGGKERFLLVASCEPLEEFEADLARIPRSKLDEAPRLGNAAVSKLRGIAAVRPADPGTPPSTAAPGLLTDLEDSIWAGQPSSVGVYRRSFVFENPPE
jgi:hypothetical protein